jgi:hypothetical protein
VKGKPVRGLENPVALVGEVEEAAGHASALLRHFIVRSSRIHKVERRRG